MLKLLIRADLGDTIQYDTARMPAPQVKILWTKFQGFFYGKSLDY